MPEVVPPAGGRGVPAVVEDEGGAVVDQPQARGRGAERGPDHQVGAVHRAVDVHGQRVQPDDPAGFQRVHRERPGDLRGEVPGARKIVHAEVDARAGAVQLAHLLVFLPGGDGRVEVHEDQLGEAQAERAGEFTDDDLGDERLVPLRGTGELHDVRPQVVGLHDAGHGAAGAEGGHVSNSSHVAQHTGQTTAGQPLASGFGSGR